MGYIGGNPSGREKSGTGDEARRRGERFLSEIKACRRLTAEEEREVCGEIAKGDEKGRTEARNALIEANLQLVAAMAGRYSCNGADRMDLIQEGCIGLMAAAERYDCGKGGRFATYAYPDIQKRMFRYKAEMEHAVEVPAYMTRIRSKVEAERNSCLLLEGREPDEKRLSELTGISTENVRFALSLSYILARGGEADEEEMLCAEDTRGDPCARAEEKEERETVAGALGVLKERDRHIILLFYGFVDPGPSEADSCRVRGAGSRSGYTMAEIGREMGISRERVRQIKDGSLVKLKNGPDAMEIGT